MNVLLGADQGCLNDFFKDRWTRLPFLYNVTPTSCYSYTPALRHHRDQIKMLHFAGAQKPWNYGRDHEGRVLKTPGLSNDLLLFIQAWWDELESCDKQLFKEHSFLQQQTSLQEDTGHEKRTSSFNEELANYRIQWCEEVERHFANNPRRKSPGVKIQHPAPNRLPRLAEELAQMRLFSSVSPGAINQGDQSKPVTRPKIRSPPPENDDGGYDARYYEDFPE